MLQDHRSKRRGESSRAPYLLLEPNRESAMGEKYRVCAYVEDHETRLGLCRVCTDENGAVRFVAVASTEVFATLDELKEGLERMRAACELPVLTITDESQFGDGFDESIELLDHFETAGAVLLAVAEGQV